ncbi:hypothetical protein [Nonomuraea endophytica]|uniref:hypothetical protein n=1 Tax=Nonomuraea endophytica TaxID=714136 RepID=UPI0037C65E5D
MPKKRSARQRGKAHDQARYEARKLAREEGLHEQHAGLVAERSGDPRFVQRRQTEDGRIEISWNTETESGRHTSGALREQLERFREKFGREPGPQDPIFFDPDASEPTPLDEGRHKAILTEAAAAAVESGVDPSFILAYRDLGYLVTFENQHLFSAVEVQAWHDAVQAHRGDDEDDEDIDEADQDGLDPEGFRADLNEGLEQVVAAVLTKHDAAPAMRLMQSFLDHIEEDTGGLLITGLFGTLMGWLAGAREHGIEPGEARQALDWIRQDLGEAPYQAALVISGFIGHAEAPDITFNEAHETLDVAFVPAMICLAAGVVQVKAAGDAYWLRQFDLGHG